MYLDPSETRTLNKEKKTTKPGDLSIAIQSITGKPDQVEIIQEIEDVLEGVCSQAQLRTIRAVFNLCTGWKQNKSLTLATKSWIANKARISEVL